MKRKAWFKIVTIFMAVMCVFMSVTISPKAAPCSVVRNQKVQYDQYISGAMPGYGTFCYFVIDNNGDTHIAYCVNSMAAAKTTANYDDIVLDGNSNQLLYKLLYYGFDGQGDITETQFPGESVNFRYLATHIAAGYAYNGTYKGISDSVATSSGIASFIVNVNNMSMPAVANPEIHIIPEHVNAQGIVEQAIAYVNETKPQTQGGLTVNKTGEVLTKLENGRFVWEEGGIPGAVYEVTKNGSHVCDLTTDNSGSAYVTGLELGTYQIKEKTAPAGYMVDVNVYSKEITSANLFHTIDVTDQRQKLIIHMKKLAYTSEAPITGGTFDLYADEDIKNAYGTVICPKDTKITSAHAENGNLNFGELPFAKYYVKESAAPADYYAFDGKISFDFSQYPANNEPTLERTEKIYNKQLPHFAFLDFTVTEATFEKYSNYQTGDNGQPGYSILLTADGTSSIENATNSPKSVIIFSAIGSVVALAIFIICKKH